MDTTPSTPTRSPLLEIVSRLLQGSNQKAQESLDIGAKYNPLVEQGYTYSGGTSNIAQDIANYLQKKNLPGQVLARAAAERRANDPQFKINQKLSVGQNISSNEQAKSQDSALQLIMGISNALGSKAGAVDQDLSNELFQIGLSKKRGFLTPQGQIDMEAMQRLEEIGKKELGVEGLNELKALNPTDYWGTLHDELQSLLQIPTQKMRVITSDAPRFTKGQGGRFTGSIRSVPINKMEVGGSGLVQ